MKTSCNEECIKNSSHEHFCIKIPYVYVFIMDGNCLHNIFLYYFMPVGTLSREGIIVMWCGTEIRDMHFSSSIYYSNMD